MIKKRIITLFIALLVIFGGVMGVRYFLSFHTVSLTLVDGVSSVQIFTKENKEIKKITTSQDIRLQNGSYYIVPAGEIVDTSHIPFTVADKDFAITIDPDYSSDYLSKLLSGQQDAIQKIITTKYSTILPKFVLNKGNLYDKGNVYATTLTQISEYASDGNDVYRLVLQKKNGTWQLTKAPALIVTQELYPDVPVAVLQKVNALIGDSDTAFTKHRTYQDVPLEGPKYE